MSDKPIKAGEVMRLALEDAKRPKDDEEQTPLEAYEKWGEFLHMLDLTEEERAKLDESLRAGELAVVVNSKDLRELYEALSDMEGNLEDWEHLADPKGALERDVKRAQANPVFNAIREEFKFAEPDAEP